MRASLDTDVVIHLYGSGKESLLFHFFDRLYMHEYLYEQELKKKGFAVFQKVSADVASGRIEIVSNKDLIEMGVQGLFQRYKREYNDLFDSGELYAVALSKAMGLVAFVSDDTKEFGPHETLVKELIEDVMPFAFYELLFLNYLSSQIDLEEMYGAFEIITTQTMNQYPMKFTSRMKKTAMRFSQKHGSARDFNWVSQYCQQQHIDYRDKMSRLKEYLSNME